MDEWSTDADCRKGGGGFLILGFGISEGPAAVGGEGELDGGEEVLGGEFGRRLGLVFYSNQGISFARKIRRLRGSDTGLVKSSCIALLVIKGVHVWKSSE